MKYCMKWLEINANRLYKSLFIYSNKIIPWSSVHDIRTRPYMVITWSSAHTITNYQFISMNTNNAVAWGHLFSLILHIYSQKPSIFVLKLCRVSPTINDTFQKYETSRIQIQYISHTCKYHKQFMLGFWETETTMTCKNGK